MGDFLTHLLTNFCLYGSKEAKGCGCLILVTFMFLTLISDAINHTSTTWFPLIIVIILFLFCWGTALKGLFSKEDQETKPVTITNGYTPIIKKNVLCIKELNSSCFDFYKENKYMDGNLDGAVFCTDHIGEFIIAYANWKINEEGIPVVYLSSIFNDETFYLEYGEFNEYIDLAGDDKCIPAIVHFKDRSHGRYRIMKADSWDTYKLLMMQFCIIVDGSIED